MVERQVGAPHPRDCGAARSGYARGFAQHIDRLSAALRLCADAQRNRERVTQLMSSLVGGLLFARAIDDPVQSDAMLHAMRRQLREQFCGEGAGVRERVKPTESKESALKKNTGLPLPTAMPSHDFMRAF